ncbi:hypothetical protein AcV7_007034 [Taiwanofungus camphoratus]|nr:hypothetical protein AcV7_007034 [Antrodia cinnamomea]
MAVHQYSAMSSTDHVTFLPSPVAFCVLSVMLRRCNINSGWQNAFCVIVTSMTYASSCFLLAGTHEMVSTALKASLPQNFSSLPLYLAESVRRYKPAPEIYHGLRHHVNKLASESRASSGMPDVWLVSGNPFDVTGARAAGLGAIWVDRARTGWKDQIPLPHEGLGPMKIVHNLEEIATLVGNSQLALSTV